MLFPTLTFAVFFVVVFGGHLILRPRPQAWKSFLIAASYLFYGWWNPKFCLLIAGSTLFNWSIAEAIDRKGGKHRQQLVSIGVVANLLVLGVFKYYDFFVVSTENLTNGAITLPIVELILPVGISFFTFQAMSYVIDVGRRNISVLDFTEFALYLAFFPQLVAGPIVRTSEFASGLHQGPHDRIEVGEAFWLIGRGLFKKVVVASYLSTHVVDPTFGAPSVASREELILGFYGYAIQIYADFSGYTDIAIGIALLLGFRFPTNFARPYGSVSMQDFWRRWHMTLSRWLRDYLYIPLGGNRGTNASTNRNIMITMLLGGLWHGAAWTMVAWGAIHGISLVVERQFQTRLKSVPNAIRWFFTFHVVTVAWVLFRAESFGLASTYLQGLATAPFRGQLDYLAILIVLGSLAFQLVPQGTGANIRRYFERASPNLLVGCAAIWLWVVVTLGPSGVAPFIYFQF